MASKFSSKLVREADWKKYLDIPLYTGREEEEEEFLGGDSYRPIPVQSPEDAELTRIETAMIKKVMEADGFYFVFGSNLGGAHGGGAAADAREKYYAEWGVGEGITGYTYALPTKGERIEYLELEEIKPYFANFVTCVNENPDKFFLVTRIGCGLAGFTNEEIAPLLSEIAELPNVYLPMAWMKILGKTRHETVKMTIRAEWKQGTPRSFSRIGC